MKRIAERAPGVALVIVLGFLVLMSAVVIALLTTSRTETVAAANYQGGVHLKHLAASATSLATGQILDATRSTKGADKTSGLLAWASQPGLIRTWDETGKGWKIFKLYSARDMVVDFDSNSRYSVSSNLAQEVPDDWPSQAAHFTDLNQPVLVEDPAGKITRSGKAYRASYPIVDPLAALTTGTGPTAVKPVDGFAVTNAPGFAGTLSETLDPTKPTAGKSANPAPMPVRWFYVLQDGTFTVPTGTANGGRTATWVGANPKVTPSRANPIVGRVAFWTDDETCKLNLNTAGEPTPWDTPRAVVIQDLNYGRYQPVQREYQRFPGHPSTSALSPVFFPGLTVSAAQKESIYALLPRIQGGGTTAATVQTTSASPVMLDRDRLYTNVDEFLFRPEMPGSDRLPNTIMDARRLQRARFFLTANSRAPELNLYGQPRISMWPVASDAMKRTALDQLAAFCSTIGSGASAKPFYFQRADSVSPTADYATITRNRELYAYLQRLTGNPVPGYGGNFLAKYPSLPADPDAIPDRDQILTEIFDYIRSINLRDPLPSATKFADNGQVTPIRIGKTQGFGRFHTVSQVGLHFICSQEGDAGILQGRTAPNDKLASAERIVNTALLLEPWSPALGFYPIYEKLFFDVQFGTTGFTLNGEQLKMRAGGKSLDSHIDNGWHNNGREHGGSGGLRGPMQGFGGGSYQWVSQGQATLPDGKTKVTGIKVTGPTMTFVGGDVTIKIYAGTSANAANLVQTLQLRIPDGKFPVPKLVRTGTEDYRSGSGDVATTPSFWWTFGGFTPAVGSAVQGRYQRLSEVPHAPGAEYADPKRQWADSGGKPGFKIGGIFRDEDVVRSIVPNHGDIRLIAAKTIVKDTDFVKVRATEWDSAADRMLHIFSSSAGTHLLYGFANEPGNRPGGSDRANPSGGTLGGIPGANDDDQLTASSLVKYHYSRLPEIRPGAGKLFNFWNDYDNGVSTWTDGSYINKPDEGNFTSTNSPYTYFAWNLASDSTGNFFSPNRLVPSPGMLSSLPTGVRRNRPWETLLFRPETRVDAGSNLHPGTRSPKDHLIMDLFWMPVIEPYAISEPFSTAGKINLNYEIAPFSYIRRATALHGAMKAEEPLVLPNGMAPIYKLWDHETNDHPFGLPSSTSNKDTTVRTEWAKAYNGQAPYNQLRRPIDVAKTLAQADERFTNGEAFRSASEICELHLVRTNETLADYQSGKIWRDALLTGENTRERPYTNLYGKLTTRSNTYTVHVRVQVLKASGNTDADFAIWNEDRVPPLGEYRGSSIIERYIDPADPGLPDFATNANAVADSAYRIRTISTRKFTP